MMDSTYAFCCDYRSEKCGEHCKAEKSENTVLHFEDIESISVHDDIKLDKPSCGKYIENYCENIRRVARVEIKRICYDFMSVFDWTM